MTGDDAQERARSASVSIGALIDAVFEQLARVGPVLAAVLASGPVGRMDLGEVDQALQRVVHRNRAVVDGAGVAFAPGALRDAHTWLEWWRLSAQGEMEFARHVFNPGSVRYYDYTEMPWFALPAASGRATAVGPYLDSGGTDRNIVTLSTPCAAADGVSVVAADLRLDQLESEFRAALGIHAPALALVNGRDRVIASTSAHVLAGTLLPAEHDTVTEVVSQDPQRLPWRIAGV
jgi:hypothetical protein